MVENKCHYLCTNINQDFTWVEEETARRNMGLYPFSKIVSWYSNAHYIVTASEASNNQLAIILDYLPDSIRHTGKSFVAEITANISENTYGSPKIRHGDYGVVARLRKEIFGDAICSYAVDVMSDLNGELVASMTLKLPFQIDPIDTSTLDPLYTLLIDTPTGLIPEDTDLIINVSLSFIQSL